MLGSFTSPLAPLFRRFKRDVRGNIAVTFALATLPIVGFIGAAVDFSSANAAKVQLQAALDSTALMLASYAPNHTDSEIQAQASKYFNAIFDSPTATNVSLAATYSSPESKIVLNGSAQVPTSFISVLGIDRVTIDGSSTTKWGTSRLRVALVLDNTGSMARDGKMTALKDATKSLLSQLKSAASNDGDVYVSIIPFSKDVNVGSSNYNASWIDWTDWDNDNETCTSSGSRGRGRGSSTCTPNNHNTWNGCITDRGPANAPGNSTWDQVVTLPDGTTNSLWPAEQYSSCPVQMMGLSYDWTAIETKVDSMQPSGSTNQPIGLVWGWQSLVGGGPLTVPPVDSNYKYQNIIILLSDGLNTQNRWYNSQTPVDNRMYQTGNGSGTCANIKAADITIYTLQVNTGGDPTSALLQNCASSSDKFYLVTSANDIAAAFTKIGSEVTKLRVAQ